MPELDDPLEDEEPELLADEEAELLGDEPELPEPELLELPELEPDGVVPDEPVVPPWAVVVLDVGFNARTPATAAMVAPAIAAGLTIFMVMPSSRDVLAPPRQRRDSLPVL
ncbi:hypothetical protein [Raineyella fluvialis]|uniref:hypothetical protein n=1 Tax=Raineyella fluvialis TaxID=2662261 RepID=UPI001E347B08|nr:hypothetical protein [Raineyella fluvialis]